MRILIFNWRDIRHHNSGGAEQVTFEHAKAWVKAGHQVTWFASLARGRKKEEEIEGIKIIRGGHEPFTIHLAAFLWYLRYGRGQFDLVVDQFHGVPFLTPLFVRGKKLAFIHEITREVWLMNPLPVPFNFLVGYFFYPLEPWIFKLYRRIPFLTVSVSTKKDLLAFGIPAKNIYVIHNGVRVKRPRPLPPKEKQLTVIFLGALAKDKGIEDAIEAFGLINQSEKNCQFWVVGGSAPLYLKKLKNKSARLGLGRKVKFWGRVPEEEKFLLLARAHVLLNPSVREGWSLVNLEANAMGTPVVAYNSPGLRDSVVQQKTGLICRVNTPEALAKNTFRVFKNNQLYRHLQDGAVKWSKQFTWAKSTRKSLRLIESLE